MDAAPEWMEDWVTPSSTRHAGIRFTRREWPERSISEYPDGAIGCRAEIGFECDGGLRRGGGGGPGAEMGPLMGRSEPPHHGHQHHRTCLLRVTLDLDPLRTAPSQGLFLSLFLSFDFFREGPFPRPLLGEWTCGWKGVRKMWFVGAICVKKTFAQPQIYSNYMK
jgi:hypothetical protein